MYQTQQIISLRFNCYSNPFVVLNHNIIRAGDGVTPISYCYSFSSLSKPPPKQILVSAGVAPISYPYPLSKPSLKAASVAIATATVPNPYLYSLCPVSKPLSCYWHHCCTLFK